ncbi:apolipoprotein N-acyltransferase [Acidisoma silvae]|uniref:Apolipoprotein N-acyltransferase n=1 Tax=Acidisoma silvae TaxID=2802396 RepID=A0A963YNL0_9PROT|nr:apolipoprotein N-acyltransferase [Acidisoma silvae]MCB8873846.1 apolipoprotein N-acyltransferase [Acidisoma silvae]
MRKTLILALIFGIVAALALPPVYLLPALWVSLPGLIWLIGRAKSWRQAGVIGLAFGFGLNVVGLYWITEPILIEAAQFWWLVPFAVPGLALAVGVFTAVPAALCWFAPPGLPRLLVLAGTWTIADLALQFVFTGFPWNFWGTDVAIPGLIGTVLIQPAAWIGVLGLTLCIVFVASLPSLGLRGFAASIALMVAWAVVGGLRLSRARPATPAAIVGVIQGDGTAEFASDRTAAIALFRRYLRLSADAVAKARATNPHNLPIVLLWPETASPFMLQTDVGARQAIADTVGPDVTVIAGMLRFGADGQSIYNSLGVVRGPGPLLATYDKWHLVPFGEYQPAWLPMQILPGEGFSRGTGPTTLHVPGIPPVGPIICYESVFSGQIIKESDRPDWIALATNDAWFGNSSGPRQHLAAGRMRAVEEGLPLARAANTGISAIFDASGREEMRIGHGRQGVLVAPLPGRLPPTLFAYWGLWAPSILGICTALLGVVLGVRRRLFRKT